MLLLRPLDLPPPALEVRWMTPEASVLDLISRPALDVTALDLREHIHETGMRLGVVTTHATCRTLLGEGLARGPRGRSLNDASRRLMPVHVCMCDGVAMHGLPLYRR